MHFIHITLHKEETDIIKETARALRVTIVHCELHM